MRVTAVGGNCAQYSDAKWPRSDGRSGATTVAAWDGCSFTPQWKAKSGSAPSIWYAADD